MPIAASPSRRAAVNLTESDAFPAIHGVHHQAFRCRDAEETRHFYEDVLRLPLALVVYHDNVPSTREYKPYYQLFFEMADGAFLAFVDLLDGRACAPDPGTPPWLNHVALEVGIPAAPSTPPSVHLGKRASTSSARSITRSSSRSIASIPTASAWN